MWYCPAPFPNSSNNDKVKFMYFVFRVRVSNICEMSFLAGGDGELGMSASVCNEDPEAV